MNQMEKDKYNVCSFSSIKCDKARTCTMFNVRIEDIFFYNSRNDTRFSPPLHIT